MAKNFLWLILPDTNILMSSVGMENINALQFGMNRKNKEIHLKRKFLFEIQAKNILIYPH